MNISGNIVIVDEWQFEIDRSIPKIVASLGKGKESNNINIASTVSYMADFTKGTISITITTDIELSKVTINGENVSATNNNGTYNITKDIYDNGNYSIYVKDVNDQYKLKNIKVLGFQKDITISTEEDLLQFAQVVNDGGGYEGKTVTLGKNLDLSTVCYKVDGTTQNDISWTPIGTESNQFKGTFDGNNKEITNIYINSTNNDQGLFGNVGTTGIIKDLILEGSIIGNNGCSGVCSWNYGKIENCVNNVNVTTIHDCAGGITSYNKGIILRCINNGAVIARGEAAGGITAFNANGEDWAGPAKSLNSFVIECINNGNVSASSHVVGGIIASHGEMGNSLGGYICNSYNTGNVSGGNGKRAGVVGQVRCRGGNGYIYNCYNRGNTEGGNEILGMDLNGGGEFVSLNNYGATDATIEKLNKESDVEQALKDTGLYRVGVWKLKNGNIALDWE